MLQKSCEHRAMVHKSSNPQTPSTREIPIIKPQDLFRRGAWKLKIGASLEFGVWDLEFFLGPAGFEPTTS